MLRNLTKASLAGLALVTAMLFSSLASAAPTPNFTVPLNGYSDVQSGSLTGTELILTFAVDPNQDVSMFAVLFGANPQIDTYTILRSLTESDEIVATGAPGDTLYFAYDSSYSYAIKLEGTAGDAYSFQLAAVPLPAAAWLFLSLLGGGAWLKRRSRKA